MGVQPTITPLNHGRGYITGPYLLRAGNARDELAQGPRRILPMTAFTLFMAIRTFNHLDRFATAHVAFRIWVEPYVVTPVLVPLARLRSRAGLDGRWSAIRITPESWRIGRPLGTRASGSEQ